MENNYKWVNWKEKDIEREVKEYLEKIKFNLKEIKKVKPEERNFKNTILALEYIDKDKINLPHFLETFVLLFPKEKIRKVAVRRIAELENKQMLIMRDRKLYQAILDYQKNKKNLKENLCSEDEKLFQDSLRSFQRMGFDLKGEEEKRFKKNFKMISQLSVKFSNNIAEYKDFIEIEGEDLKDLPENFRESLKKGKDGLYKISIESTQSMPFLENSTNSEKRKELSIKISKSGGRKNLDILSEVLRLRKENAKLLGYKNHAEFVLEDRMAKIPEVVEKFENDLVKKLKKQGEKEMEELTDFKNKFDKTKNEKLKFYDGAFYSKKLQKEKFDVDSEINREYFELENVQKEMFDLFGKLFGITLKKKTKKLWHKDVEFFEIFDTKSREKISEIIFDLFPRDGKHQGGFMLNIFTGMKDLNDDKYIKPTVIISCNFRPKTKKTPSLLSVNDIETLFHEFGHALHGALTKAIYSSQSGPNVLWDFVEVPSQLLENWINNKKVLKKFSKHYKTGKKMPKKMIENILRVDKFMKATFTLRQLSLGILDFELHTKGHKNPEKLYAKLSKELSGKNLNKENLFPASFHHLMGYDAGYYSYMWALVYADDFFSEFKKNGIFDKKTGMKYRKEILEVGSSRDELESVEKFLGRKSNNKAFLEKLK